MIRDHVNDHLLLSNFTRVEAILVWGPDIQVVTIHLRDRNIWDWFIGSFWTILLSGRSRWSSNDLRILALNPIGCVYSLVPDEMRGWEDYDWGFDMGKVDIPRIWSYRLVQGLLIHEMVSGVVFTRTSWIPTWHNDLVCWSRKLLLRVADVLKELLERSTMEDSFFLSKLLSLYCVYIVI